jgi:hypothetical protein
MASGTVLLGSNSTKEEAYAASVMERSSVPAEGSRGCSSAGQPRDHAHLNGRYPFDAKCSRRRD